MDTIDRYVPHCTLVCEDIQLRRKGIIIWRGDDEAINYVFDGDLDRLKSLDINGTIRTMWLGADAFCCARW